MPQIGEHLAQPARRGHRLVADRRGRTGSRRRTAHRPPARFRRAGAHGTARARTRRRPCRPRHSTNTWRTRGQVALASGPQASASTGTSRQPASARPASARWRSNSIAARLATGRIEEYQPGREAFARHDAVGCRQRAQPVRRAMDQHAAAVAADAVGIHAAAMGEFRQRGERGIDQRSAGAPVDLRDQAEAAAVVLESRVIQRRRAACRHLTPPGCAGCRDAGGTDLFAQKRLRLEHNCCGASKYLFGRLNFHLSVPRGNGLHDGANEGGAPVSRGAAVNHALPLEQPGRQPTTTSPSHPGCRNAPPHWTATRSGCSWNPPRHSSTGRTAAFCRTRS